MKRIHGNSHENKELHHLYALDDKEEETVFKYGISDDPIEKDGMSKRMRTQLNLFNLVANSMRFVGRIIRVNIPGRKEAEKIEDEYNEIYRQKYGDYPRGNRELKRRR